MPAEMKSVFITGATGYMGKRLVKALLKDGYRVIALTRNGSEHKLPAGTEIVIANPFDSRTFQDSIPQDSVFVHLNGLVDSIKEGNKVTFEVEQSPKGFNAIKVKLDK